MTTKVKENSTEANADFLPLEGGPARKLPKGGRVLDNKATVLFISRIPHGFYEEEMKGFFQQFGTVKRLKIVRNRKTGKSKHYGFIEFEYPEVAQIVADSMHNYLLFEHMLQVHPIPPERVHPKLFLTYLHFVNRWKGLNRRQRTPVDFVQIERMKHNKDRTPEEHKKLLKAIMKQDKKRRSRIEAAGIDYECPEIIARIMLVVKCIGCFVDYKAASPKSVISFVLRAKDSRLNSYEASSRAGEYPGAT
ncbi:MKI67 FHA domain-interacting nucleolar phosphoprotein [Bienertia sinuspersici]